MRINKQKLLVAMARKQMNNTTLAKTTGISPATVGNMLRGCDMSLPTVGKVAKALGVDVTEIIED